MKNKKSLSTAHELWYHTVVQLSGLFCSCIITHFIREERLDKQRYAAFTRVHCCWYQGMERGSKPAHGLHWEMLQEGQGLDSLFSGPPSHMFEL